MKDTKCIVMFPTLSQCGLPLFVPPPPTLDPAEQIAEFFPLPPGWPAPTAQEAAVDGEIVFRLVGEAGGDVELSRFEEPLQ